MYNTNNVNENDSLTLKQKTNYIEKLQSMFIGVHKTIQNKLNDLLNNNNEIERQNTIEYWQMEIQNLINFSKENINMEIPLKTLIYERGNLIFQHY